MSKILSLYTYIVLLLCSPVLMVLEVVFLLLLSLSYIFIPVKFLNVQMHIIFSGSVVVLRISKDKISE